MKQFFQNAKLIMKAGWNILAFNLKCTWKHFYQQWQLFWQGGFLKIVIDTIIAVIACLVFPPLAIAFASCNFIGAPHPVINVTIAVLVAIGLSMLGTWAMELIVVLAAIFVASFTRDCIAKAKMYARQQEYAR